MCHALTVKTEKKDTEEKRYRKTEKKIQDMRSSSSRLHSLQ